MKAVLVFIAASLSLSIYTTTSDVANFKDVIYIRDTVFINDTVYLDTCDSQFLKAIIDTETKNFEKMDRAFKLNVHPISGHDNKKEWYGQFQISQIYLDGCKLAKILNYDLDDMLDPRKALIVVIAKTIRKIEEFEADFSRLPTFEELARIYNGGYSNFKIGRTSITDKYATEFNKRFCKHLGNKDYICKN